MFNVIIKIKEWFFVVFNKKKTLPKCSNEINNKNFEKIEVERKGEEKNSKYYDLINRIKELEKEDEKLNISLRTKREELYSILNNIEKKSGINKDEKYISEIEKIKNLKKENYELDNEIKIKNKELYDILCYIENVQGAAI